jgi:ketosteroid isomerase-like protein
MTDEEQIIAETRSGFEAWSAWDIDQIIARSSGAGAGLGFGFRTRDMRAVDSVDAQRVGLEAWFGTLERYTIEDIDVNCIVNGDIATVWGFYTEDFKHRGEDPEHVRVRYSMVRHQRDGDWQVVWNHRDIQEFTDDGFYIKKPIQNPPT